MPYWFFYKFEYFVFFPFLKKKIKIDRLINRERGGEEEEERERI